jgi:hypothetical protein
MGSMQKVSYIWKRNGSVLFDKHAALNVTATNDKMIIIIKSLQRKGLWSLHYNDYCLTYPATATSFSLFF